MEKKDIKLGIIGLGKLGENHLRIFHSLLSSKNIIICDNDAGRLNKLKKEYKVEGISDYKNLAGRINCVSIVTPTETHFEIADFFLEKNIHTFVEKPVTNEIDTALRLLELAEEKKCLLQVGHVERYNPAVISAAEFITTPKFIEAQRLSPFDPRVAGTDVIFDLMIHDIDIILALVKDKIQSIEAFGAVLFSGTNDIVKARIKFQSGAIADLSASRVSLEKFRKIRIFQTDSYISLDYMRQALKIVRKKNQSVKSMNDLEVIYPRIKTFQPLENELSDFLGSIIIPGHKPRVDVREAVTALEIASKIREIVK